MVVRKISARIWLALAISSMVVAATILTVVVLLPRTPQVDSQASGQAPVAEGTKSPSVGPSIAVIMSSLTSLAAMAVAFYLYRWRRIVTARNEILVPETFSAMMNRHDKRMQSVITTLNS